MTSPPSVHNQPRRLLSSLSSFLPDLAAAKAEAEHADARASSKPAQEDELLLAMAESDLEEKLNEIRKTNSNLVIIGKPTSDIKEEYDAEVEDDDADNVEESDGDDFDQETG